MDSEKECVSNANFDKCAVVLLDVAGTTTSIAFVKETLFKFATDQAQTFLKDSFEDEEVKKAVKLLQDGDTELDRDGAAEVFIKLTEENSDNKGLKTLQGLVYKKGYEDGTLKAHVFSDIPKAFENWSKERKVAIYSTGSIESQKLLFAHSTEGDLSAHISNYFDQSVGLKTESGSYKKIAEELKVKAEEILFINDNIDELNAAKEAGLSAVLVKREGNAEIPEKASKEFIVIPSFTALSFDNSNKRKNEDDIDGTTEAPPTKVAKKDEQENEVAAAAESSTVVQEKSNVVEEKSATVEEKTQSEQKPEAEESDKPEMKEQPVEKSTLEPEVEPMEVDNPEIENNTTEEDNKVDSTTDNSTSNATPTPKEVTNENVTESMEIEQIKESAVTEVKTVVDKTDTAKSTGEEEAIKTNREATAETIETETKTEKPEPNKDLEVASSSEKVDVKENGVVIVEVEVLEKEAESTTNSEDTKVADDAMEPVKEKEQNGELVKDNTETITDAVSKNEEVKTAESTDTKNEEKGDLEVKEVAKEEDEKISESKVAGESVKEVEVAEKLNTPESTTEISKDVAEVSKEHVVVESTKTMSEESKEHMEVDSTNEITESKKNMDNIATEKKGELKEIKKCSEDTSKTQTDLEKCSDETKEPTTSEVCIEEPKGAAVAEKCHDETKTKPTVVEKCAEEMKSELTVTEKSSEETKAEEKNESTDNENNISETVTNDLKDNTKESVSTTANTSANERKIGNGSCDVKTADDITENGEVTNGQENGDKKNNETDSEETDIKIKKLETNAGSPAVSVEV